MKKSLSLLLALMMLLSLAACGGKPEKPAPSTTPDSSTTVEQSAPADTPDETPEETPSETPEDPAPVEDHSDDIGITMWDGNTVYMPSDVLKDPAARIMFWCEQGYSLDPIAEDNAIAEPIAVEFQRYTGTPVWQWEFNGNMTVGEFFEKNNVSEDGYKIDKQGWGVTLLMTNADGIPLEEEIIPLEADRDTPVLERSANRMFRTLDGVYTAINGIEVTGVESLIEALGKPHYISLAPAMSAVGTTVDWTTQIVILVWKTEAGHISVRISGDARRISIYMPGEEGETYTLEDSQLQRYLVEYAGYSTEQNGN